MNNMQDANLSVANSKVVRSYTGKVVSCAGNKSITVLVERRVKHPLLGKVVKKFKKYHAHDEHNQCKVDDIVTIIEAKPISKTKTWSYVAANHAAIGDSSPEQNGGDSL